MKENKRKSSNRKEQRKLRSCCKVLQEIIGLTDDAQEMIAKVDKGNFSFTIDNSDFVPEKLLTLKPKTHKSGLLLLIEKIYLCLVEANSWQKRLSTTWRNRTCQRGPLLKSAKQDNTCQLNLHLHLQMQCMTLQTIHQIPVMIRG